MAHNSSQLANYLKVVLIVGTLLSKTDTIRSETSTEKVTPSHQALAQCGRLCCSASRSDSLPCPLSPYPRGSSRQYPPPCPGNRSDPAKPLTPSPQIPWRQSRRWSARTNPLSAWPTPQPSIALTNSGYHGYRSL